MFMIKITQSRPNQDPITEILSACDIEDMEHHISSYDRQILETFRDKHWRPGTTVIIDLGSGCWRTWSLSFEY